MTFACDIQPEHNLSKIWAPKARAHFLGVWNMYFAKCVFPVIFHQIDIRTSASVASVVSNDTRADETTVAYATVRPLRCTPAHNVALTTSQYTRNLSVLSIYLKISQIRLNSNPVISTIFNQSTETSILLICNIYSFTVWSFRTLGQRLHTKVPRTKWCINIPKYLRFV